MRHPHQQADFFHPDLFFLHSLVLLQLIKPQNSLDEDSVNATLQQRDLKPATPAPQQITILLKEKIRHLSDQFRTCCDFIFKPLTF